MKNFSIFTLLMLTILSAQISAAATTFTYNYSGNTFLFTTLNDTQVSTIQSSQTNVKGDLEIPPTVSYGNKTYTVTEIGYNSFNGFNDITSVTIPKTITKIVQGAFNNCKNLKTLYYNAENCSFCGTNGDAFGTQLQEIIIGDGVKTIPSDAFYNSSITSIHLPKSVETIGSNAFKSCWQLANISGGENIRYIGESAFYNCYRLEVPPIGNSTTYIGSSAFENCKLINSVTIPESVNYLGTQAFYNCNSLETLYYNASRLTVGGTSTSVYFGSNIDQEYYLHDVFIGENVKMIPEYLFRYCKIQSLRIPKSVTEIGIGAFGYGKVANLEIEDPNLWAKIKFGGTDTHSTAANPLCNSHSFSLNGEEVAHLDLNIEDNTVSDYAFYSAQNLTTIRIKGSRVGVNSFGQCSNVTDICIDIDSLEALSFGHCSSLRSIYCMRAEPPKVSMDPFSGCSDLILYVPKDSRAKYENDEYWRQFLDIVETEFDDLDSIFQPDYKLSYVSNIHFSNNGWSIDSNMPYQIYSLNGNSISKTIDELSSGFYFVRQGNNVKKFLVK